MTPNIPPSTRYRAAPVRSGCPSGSPATLTARPVLTYVGDSDAHIVRGLVAILLTLYSGRKPQAILDTDAIAIFDELGFREHLTPQRSNGLRAMVERIRRDAREALRRRRSDPILEPIYPSTMIYPSTHLHPSTAIYPIY